MIIKAFEKENIDEAIELFWSNYEEERREVKELPDERSGLDRGMLEYISESGLGVAAMEEGKLVGFIGCFGPWEGMYDSWDGLGVFSPLGAHGAVKENRGRIYQDMYEYLARDLASRKIIGLGLALFAHDRAAREALCEYGFGMRCKDQIRLMESDREIVNKDLSFAELSLEEFPILKDMRYALHRHLKQSPCFMQSTDEEFEDWFKKVLAGDRRTFVAKTGDETVAYIDVAEDGENFVTENPLMRNIQGAYCKPEYRGRGIYEDLLTYVIGRLKDEGYKYLGVDHESYNPTANRFWGKHFKEYTNSMVRKIEIWSMEKEN